MKAEQRLQYTTPAQTWVEALPLGNGMLGAMVFGRPDQELVQLNESSFWSGYPDNWINPEVLPNLQRVRKLLLDGKTSEAQEIIESRMLGKLTAAYLPLADLHIEYEDKEAVEAYRRELDLSNALVKSTFVRGGKAFQTQAFVSYPDKVLSYSVQATGRFGLSIRLSSAIRHAVDLQPDGDMVLKGVAPSDVIPHNIPTDTPFLYGETPQTSGMRFCVFLRVLTDGVYRREGNIGLVSDATWATILVTAATSFNGFDKHPFTEGRDELRLAQKAMESAAAWTDDERMNRHLADYRELFDRVSLSLGENPPDVPLHERTKAYDSADSSLVQLAFDYGRYLMIAGSRPGGQAMNLQGLWNKDPQACWRCNYTTNINTQMNYWPAPVCRLPECQQPFNELMEHLSQTGARVAREHYGCGGWMFHHNTDVWAQAVPGSGASAPRRGAGWKGSTACLFWPMGGVWLCSNIWQQYAFTGDREYLQRVAYPLLKGAAQFCLDWMVEKGEELTTCPSTSPENGYVASSGEDVNVDVGTTCDISLLYDLFTHCIQCFEILGTDAQLAETLREALRRLPPLRVGLEGQLLEWSQEFGERTLGHRHVSHLFALYPGDRIRPEQDPELARACSVSLQRRLEHGGGGTGWGLAWLLCLYARLKDSRMACEIIRRFFRDSVYPNLFDLHPPLAGARSDVFQIDGNFGFTAGVAEMLLQSDGQTIWLLPCLPESWANGAFRGLGARGGFAVDCRWKGGRVQSVCVHGHPGSECTVVCGDDKRILRFAKGETRKEWNYE